VHQCDAPPVRSPSQRVHYPDRWGAFGSPQERLAGVALEAYPLNGGATEAASFQTLAPWRAALVMKPGRDE